MRVWAMCIQEHWLKLYSLQREENKWELPYSLIFPTSRESSVLFSFFSSQNSGVHIPWASSAWRLSKSLAVHLEFSVKWKRLSVGARTCTVPGSSGWRLSSESAEPQAWCILEWKEMEAVGEAHSHAIDYQLQQEQSLVLSSIWPCTPCCSALSCLVSSRRYGRSVMSLKMNTGMTGSSALCFAEEINFRFSLLWQPFPSALRSCRLSLWMQMKSDMEWILDKFQYFMHPCIYGGRHTHSLYAAE